MWRLTPEMKSTGEVLGVDSVYEKALLKGFLGAGYQFFKKGTILATIRDKDKEEALEILKEFYDLGFDIVATKGTAVHLFKKGIDVKSSIEKNAEIIQDKIKQGEINIVINTPSVGKDPQKDGFQIRSSAELYKIPCFTSLDTAKAYLTALKTSNQGDILSYETINYYVDNQKQEILI